MSEPSETLSLISELAIALAGFSGIVVVLGRRAGQLGPVDKRRLDNLFLHAALALATSLLALTLLHTSIQDTTVWRVTSAAWALPFPFVLVRDWRRVRAAGGPESPRMFAAAYTAGVLAFLLQVANSAFLYSGWPLFAALCLNLLLGFQQFVALLYARLGAA